MIAVDTDIFIDLMKGVKKSKEFFEENKEKISFSAITKMELLAGKKCDEPEERQKIIELLRLYDELIVDEKIAVLAGDVRRGYGISPTDAIIAATAIINNKKLATRNIKDFSRISELKLMSVY